jgi:NHL repeat-containing protein
MRHRALTWIGLLAAFLLVCAAGATRSYGYVSLTGDWTSADWPSGFASSDVGALAIGPSGTIYVADRAHNRIDMFSSEGAPVGSFGSAVAQGGGPPADGTFEDIVGIAATSTGDVYVLDAERHPSVQRFDAHGTFEAEFATQGTGCLALCSRPTSIALTQSGDLLVVAGADTAVDRFSPAGKLEQTWGREGSGPGQFGCTAPLGQCTDGPHGIAVGPDGLVYVTDTQHNRVEVFTSDGKYLRQWSVGGPQDTYHQQPRAIAVAPNGDVLVSGYGWRTVAVYTESGRPITEFGEDLSYVRCDFPPCPKANGHGDLDLLTAIAIAPGGDIYTTSADFPQLNALRLQRFRMDDYSRVPAPGTLEDKEVEGTVSLTETSSANGSVTASVAWTPSCLGVGGVPSWGVALTYVGGSHAHGRFYRPVGFMAPQFAPGPPKKNLYGFWLLPDGTNLGRADPHQSAALALGSAGKPVSGIRHALRVVIAPGVRVRALLRVICTYTSSDGAPASHGDDFYSATIATRR